MSSKPVFTLLTAVMISILSGGCNHQIQSVTTGQSELKIGVVWPMGDQQDMFEQGVDLAVEELNASGGVLGRRVSLVKRDSQSDVSKGIIIAKEFADDKTIAAVIGYRESDLAIPAAALLDSKKKILLSPGTSSPKFLQPYYQYIFRSVLSTNELGEKLAVLAARKGYKRLIVCDADNGQRDIIKVMAQQGNKLGVVIVDVITNKDWQHNLNAAARRWQAFAADAMVVLDRMPSGTNFIINIRQAGLTIPIIANVYLDTPAFLQTVGLAGEGLTVMSLFDAGRPAAETQRFVASFQTRYGNAPDFWAAHGYDAVMLLANAITNAGSLEADGVALQLRKTQNFAGAARMYSGHSPDSADVLNDSETGELTQGTVLVKTVKNRQFVDVQLLTD